MVVCYGIQDKTDYTKGNIRGTDILVRLMYPQHTDTLLNAV